VIEKGWFKRVSLVMAAVFLLVATAIPAVSKAAASNELPHIVQIASPNLLLALDDEGNVWCRGIHLISVKDHFYPKPMVKVKGLDKVKSLSTDGMFALKEDGTVWELEKYTSAQDNDASVLQTRFVGQHISYLKDIVKVGFASGLAALAVDKDGKAWVFEPADYWEKRDPHLNLHDYASEVEGIADIQDFASGRSGILFLKKDGTVWVKETAKMDGSLNYENIRSAVPKQIKELTDIVKLGNDMALKKDGTVWVWGANAFAKNGEQWATVAADPFQVAELTDIVDFSNDSLHALFVKKDGTVWSWGYMPEKSEKLGYNPNLVWKELSKIDGVEEAISVSTQSEYNNMWADVVLKKDGTVWLQDPKSHNEFYEELLQMDFRKN
jgi:alpha-tubulin suppressor-like RCC1 family protein